MALQFLSPIHKAGRQLGLYFAPRMERFGIAPGEGHLVSYLRSYAPCPVGELHRVFGLQRSTLTSMLDRLEEKELIVRSLHPEDRRSFLIELTKSGRRLGDSIQKDVEDLEAQIRSRVKPSEIKGFERVLAALAEITQVEVRERKDP